MMKNEIIFENALSESKAFEIVKNDLVSGLGHAYMIVSPDDEAVYQLFRLIACEVLCSQKSACIDCVDCQKVLHFNHENVFWFNQKRGDIKVDEVKELMQSVLISAQDGRQKLYFVNRADLMNSVAQNKILKTLEEPPKNVTIFLGVSNSQAMKDTIRSRCRTINLDTFSYETVYNEIFALTNNKNVASISASCSEGELGKAQKIALSTTYVETYNKVISTLENLNNSGNIAHFLSKSCLPENLDDFLNIMAIIMRDMLISKHNDDLIFSKHLANDIQKLAPRFSERAIVEIESKIVELRKKIVFYINTTTILEELFFTILEAKHKWH